LVIIAEGGIFIYEKAKKDRERYAFLFDNMLIMCKPTGQRRNTPSAHDYRFKEKLLIKHIDVTDIDDTDGWWSESYLCWLLGHTCVGY